MAAQGRAYRDNPQNRTTLTTKITIPAVNIHRRRSIRHRSGNMAFFQSDYAHLTHTPIQIGLSFAGSVNFKLVTRIAACHRQGSYLLI